MDQLPAMFEASKDSKTHRVCGICEESKPFDQFYRDGKDSYGNIKYRRDCKECYKRARFKEQKRKGGKEK